MSADTDRSGITFKGLLEYAEICRRRSDELMSVNSSWALQWWHAARVIERIVECNRPDTATTGSEQEAK